MEHIQNQLQGLKTEPCVMTANAALIVNQYKHINSLYSTDVNTQISLVVLSKEKKKKVKQKKRCPKGECVKQNQREAKFRLNLHYLVLLLYQSTSFFIRS